MTADDGYEAWLRSNPAPDLQELLRKHGSYDKIPAEAWTEHDRTTAEWQERRRKRSAGAPSSEIRDSDRADPEAVCVCGLSGIYMRLRKGGGRAIWRCEAHRDQWPDYADGIPSSGRVRMPMTEILMMTTVLGTVTLALMIAVMTVIGWLRRWR